MNDDSRLLHIAQMLEEILDDGAEQWHIKQHTAVVDGPGQEAFVPGLGTVRECVDCGCLIAGGRLLCKRCMGNAQ